MHTQKNALESFEVISARSDFVDIQKNGDHWHSSSLILQARKHNHDDHITRIGYTVSKRVNKSAVKRNRVKRRLRAAAAEILSQHAKTGYDYVLIARKNSQDYPYKGLLKDLKWCLKRMGYIEENKEK